MQNLVDQLLEKQAKLQTPVAQFSAKHRQISRFTSSYRQLIPLDKPGPGEQYSFEVDLDRCTGCKACVAACHSLNGLEEHETWRDVGLLHGGFPKSPYLQTVTTACHHCEDPACLEGCPVDAYEKDPHTGIVLHLDDQCIGCQYCTLKCPYDVPKYSKKLGIVRKCDMCHSRLAEGEAPACVQACPTEAIRIVKVSSKNYAETESVLPGTVTSSYTRPTTTYVSKRPIPLNTAAADQDHHEPEHAHWPLIGMLTLTQASVGLAGAALFFDQAFAVLLFSVVFCILGLNVSVLHLGKPLKAWRVFIGLTHSWLSREIIVFGAFFPLLFLCCAASSPLFQKEIYQIPDLFIKLGITAALVTGLLGVFCSAMLYHDTRRPFWKMDRTAFQFVGTCGILASASCLILTDSLFNAVILVVLSALKMGVAAIDIKRSHTSAMIRASHKLLTTSLRKPFYLRLALSALGGVLLPIVFRFIPSLPLAGFILLLNLGAEILERMLYFQAVVRYKMPGTILPVS